MKITSVELNNNSSSDITKIILDSTTLVAGTEVEGLVYIKSFKEKLSDAGTVTLSLYGKDKQYRTIHMTINHVNKNNLSTETINKWIGKVVLIKGTVSYFLNLNIINIIEINEVPGTGLSETDFIPVCPNLSNQVSKFRQYLSEYQQQDSNYTEAYTALNNLNLVKVLADSVIAKDLARRGDGLIVCNTLIHNFESLCTATGERVTPYQILYIISSLGLIQTLETKRAKSTELLDTTNLSGFVNLNNIIRNYKLLGPETDTKGIQEFTELYNCFYFEAQPTTLLNKFIIHNYHAVSMTLEALYMEQSMSPGNTKLFNKNTHTKLK